jgi:hypothetical protein
MKNLLPVIAVVAVLGFAIHDAHDQAEKERAFEAMPPATHLAEAGRAIERSDLDQAIRHLDTGSLRSPQTPEGREALALWSEVSAKSKQRDKAQLEARRQAEEASMRAEEARQNTERIRKDAAANLERDLAELGYGYKVTAAGDEMQIVSGDFGETELRVRFLAVFRNRPAVREAYRVGLTQVRLQQYGWRSVGFSEAYGLNLDQ